MARRIVLVLLVFALLIFLPPWIKLQRFQSRIAQSISGAIGRKVTFSQVHLRVLPEPGFVFSGFAIAEDPSFGMEPMLSSDQVVARLRLASLWRGRLEIARLSFDSPSLNLARDDRGLWNVGNPIRQAATVRATPTGERYASASPRFPYIEASDARVNFKFGKTKQAFSLLESDFSLWLASENHWEMRLRARPVRTDASLGDTGTLRADVSFVRSHGEAIEDLPVTASVRWDNAQLGQMSWLLTGEDRGWRGDLDLRAELEGTPKLLHMRTHVSLDGFRRYDIALPEGAHAEFDCATDIARQNTQREMHFSAEALQCEMPVGEGKLSAAGSVSWAERDYDLTLTATNVPMQSALAFYRRAKLNVSATLHGEGRLQGGLRLSSNVPCVVGALRVEAASFTDTPRNVDLRVGDLLLSAPLPESRKKGNSSCLLSNVVPLDFGAPVPLSVRARLDSGEFAVAITGAAESERLLAAVKSFGLLARDYHASGMLDMDVTLFMHPRGFAFPRWIGRVQAPELQFPQGITLRRLSFELVGDQVSLQQFTSTLPDLRTTVSGSLTWPVRCDAPPCGISFALRASSLDLDTINRAFNPVFRRRNWLYLPRFLGGNETKRSPMSLLLAFNGKGRIQVDRLVVRRLLLTDFSSTAAFSDNRLVLTDASSKALEGDLSGNAEFIFEKGVMTSGEFDLHDADLSSTASIIGVPWARGRGAIDGSFAFEGIDQQTIARTFRSNFTFSARDGALRGFGESGDLSFRAWNGEGTLRSMLLTVTSSRIESSRGEISLQGTIDKALALDLKAVRGSSAFDIAGTLAVPIVTPASTPAYSASKQPDASNQKQRKR